MNWTKWIRNSLVRSGLCFVLLLAILVSIGIPGSLLRTVKPENPLDDVKLQDVDNLLLGDGDRTHTDRTEADQKLDPGKTGGTEPWSTEPAETDTDETKPEQTEPPGSEPEQTNPEETISEDVQPDDPAAGDGDEGQEDGSEGEDGGEENDLDLSMVMTWYKYGTQPKTIVCGPSDTVSKAINTSQLHNGQLKYDFFPYGEDADNVTIRSVQVKAGDGVFSEISQNGTVSIDVPEGGKRDYTFQVTALLQKRDSQGDLEDREIRFAYVLHCSYSLDLELELSWTENDGTGSVTCTANKTAVKTLESNELTENVFSYTPKLIGSLAEKAKLRNAEYTTASGGSGILQTEGGSLVLQTVDGAGDETYYLTFEVSLQDDEGMEQIVFFRITIVFVETPDIDLSFTWLDRGITRRTLICQPEGTVSQDIRNNQLSAGAVKYEIQLTGADAAGARILNISYISEASGGGMLETSGALAMNLPEGCASNTYTIQVVALANGKQLHFQISLRYTMDVSLQMRYSVMDNGIAQQRIVLCENGKSKTAEAVYDDQLTEGLLTYEMTFVGSNLEITSVACYQSGSGRTVKLDGTGDIQLLLKNGKTGENNFVITAKDDAGTIYEFKINIPYKHRGENIVKIATNMKDGQVVTNETETNLNVSAWTEDEAGNIVSYIPANGVDTKLIVTLDGRQLDYVSSSGPASEYILISANPEVGDTNRHILHIYAEDAYGNYGELTLNLTGQRNQAGQKKGSATIYVDMTVLGLGIVGSVNYEVLADEPVSYSIAKAILGMDTGDPYGAAAESLGWKGRYTGTLDTGFYLQSLTPGVTGQALEESPWSYYGSNEEEILQSIDQHFGKGTGLATLWRCIYRNGLNKSSGSGGAYGEHDYTNGSGWLFSLDGTYYPGLAMSEYSLEDGDVLTLRYSLAYGWDVGGGTAGYGNPVGYCVTAVNGSFYINHQMQPQEKDDGSMCYVCRYCGLTEDCTHENAAAKNLGDGNHILYCEDCGTAIGDPEVHIWECTDDIHTCTACQASEAHNWKEVEGSNTASCTEGGIRTLCCTDCGMAAEEESPAKGHSLNNRWNHTKTEHSQKCSVCQEILAESRGTHQYEYDASDDDWYCRVCQAGHDWDYCGNQNLVVRGATCREIVYYCAECDLELIKTGDYPQYHQYADGKCSRCGAEEPGYIPPDTEPDPTEPPDTEPAPTEPPTTPSLEQALGTNKRRWRKRNESPDQQYFTGN